MDEVIGHFEFLIRIQRREIRVWWIWVICITLSGAAVVIYGLTVSTSSNPDLYKSLAGAFLMACALFPYKNIPPRRERIATYVWLIGSLRTTVFSEDEKRQFVATWVTEAMKVPVQRGPNA